MERSQTLARALGVASVGLGVPQTAAPEAFARFVGVKDDDTARDVIRFACGVRELGAAAGIFAIERKRPLATVCTRIAGDLFDLGLLVAALTSKRGKDPQRIGIALGAVAGIAALDAFTALQLAREPQQPVKHAITINRPRFDVEKRWRAFSADADWISDATVYFKDAPGDRGTEVHVALRRRPTQDAKDALRHFKQIVETGEVVRSDGAPEGQSAKRMLKQRPAQPVPVEA
jgi:uncharacterized membrane protein